MVWTKLDTSFLKDAEKWETIKSFEEAREKVKSLKCMNNCPEWDVAADFALSLPDDSQSRLPDARNKTIEKRFKIDTESVEAYPMNLHETYVIKTIGNITFSNTKHIELYIFF